MMREKLLLFCALLANWALVIGLKLEKVTIPQYGMVDGSIKLGCEFLLESDKLYSLKWYKDGQEFFRYLPTSPDQPIIFNLDAVYVDITQSDMNQVVLKNISLSTSGTYKCEVSADRPSFRTLFQQSDLIVIAPPKTLPHMDCVPPTINVGDTVNCNCTSYSSKPAASLMFYLNDDPANFGDMVEYLPVAESYGLETSVLGLGFQVDSRHLQNGILNIICTATTGHKHFVSNISLTEASINVNAQPSIPGHNRLLSGGSSPSQGLLFPLSLLGSEVMRRNFVHFL